MKDLLEWAKAHAKPDANVAEFEELAKKYAIPETKETAWDFMQKTPAFKSAMDAEVSRAVAAHDERYKASEVPKLEKELRDKLMKELHPEETPAEKRIRELEEKDAKREAEIAKERRLNAALKKASEKGFDPELAAILADLEDGDKKIDLFAEKIDGLVKSKYETTAREKLGGSTPMKGAPVNAKSQTEIDAMQPRDRFAFFTGGGVVRE